MIENVNSETNTNATDGMIKPSVANTSKSIMQQHGITTYILVILISLLVGFLFGIKSSLIVYNWRMSEVVAQGAMVFDKKIYLVTEKVTSK